MKRVWNNPEVIDISIQKTEGGTGGSATEANILYDKAYGGYIYGISSEKEWKRYSGAYPYSDFEIRKSTGKVLS